MKKVLFICLVGGLILSACKTKQKSVVSQEQELVMETSTSPKKNLTSFSDALSPVIEPVDSLMNQSIVVDSMRYERTPCFGTCPTFVAVFHSNGTLSYNGRVFVDSIGNYTAQVPLNLYRELDGIIDEIGYLKMADVYDNTQVTDIPSVNFEYWSGGIHKKIKNRIGGPKDLQVLAKHLDYMIYKAENWVKKAEK